MIELRREIAIKLSACEGDAAKLSWLTEALVRCWADNDAQRDSAAVAVEALRRHVICHWYEKGEGPPDGTPGNSSCLQCNGEWKPGEAELHKPGCLAALRGDP